MDDIDYTDKNLLPVDGASLWQGCILAACVNAVMLPEYPFILNDHVWSGGLYQTMDHAGAKAVLAFSGTNAPLLGVFRQFSSQRVKLVITDKYAVSHFKAAPEEIQELAKESFCLFEEPVGEQSLPVVTTGFWSEDGKLLSRDSFEDWLLHGGSILENQTKPFEEAMEYYEQYCSMDPLRIGIVERIYKARIKSREKTVLLGRADQKVIRESGDEHNMAACEEAFGAIQVYFER